MRYPREETILSTAVTREGRYVWALEKDKAGFRASCTFWNFKNRTAVELDGRYFAQEGRVEQEMSKWYKQMELTPEYEASYSFA
jgi:hypothetical protein